MAPLLEQDIESLQALDKQRERCRSLLEGAGRAIIQSVSSGGLSSNEDWESAGDDIERAMVLQSLNLIRCGSTLDLTKEDRQEIDTERDNLRQRLSNTTIASGSSKRLPSG